MKSASTAARTEYLLYDIANGSRTKPLIQLDYYGDDAAWTTLADIKSLNVNTSNQNRVYGRFATLPPANACDVTIDNKQEKYSPGSSGDFDGVLIRNRRIRPYIGYEFNDTTSVTYTHDPDASTGRIMYHTKVLSNEILNDITSAVSFTNLPGITDDWTFYGDLNYDAGLYQPEGYYLSSYIDFYVYDTETLQQLIVTADTAGMLIYYRASNSLEELQDNVLSFTYGGTTVNGAKTITLSDITTRWFQFCIVFNTGVWGTGTINSVQVVYTQSAEFFSQGEYLMDDPGFEEEYGNYSAAFSARDDLKKAFETEITCPSYSAATDIAQIIKDIADRAGIPYDTIADTGYTVKIADSDNFQNVKAIEAYAEIMLYLTSKNVNYRLHMLNGYLTLSTVTTPSTSVDWQIHYKYNNLKLSKRYEANKVLQRVSVLSYDHITDPEEQLASDSFTDVTGDTLTWTKDAIFLRIVTSGSGTLTVNSIDLAGKSIDIDVSGTLTVTVFGGVLKEGFSAGDMVAEILYTDTTPKNIGLLPPNSIVINVECQVVTAFDSSGTDYIDIGITGNNSYFANDVNVASAGVATVTRSAGSFDIVDAAEGKQVTAVYIPGTSGQTAGKAYVRIEYIRLARYRGEAIYLPNAQQEGFTQKIVNRLVQSNAEATTLAENVIAQYGAPKFQITATLPCNPLIEVGDNLLVWSKNSNTKNIFRVDEISINWQAEGASLIQSLVLTDTGVELSNFNWDDGGLWDNGDLWDQDLGTSVTSDSTTYSAKIITT